MFDVLYLLKRKNIYFHNNYLIECRMMAVMETESHYNDTNVLETPKKGNCTESIKSYMSRKQCNPFLKSIVSKYRDPVCSPSLFKFKSPKCDQDSPGGSIEYISLMKPAKIDENVIDHFQNDLDPEAENEAQQAIKRFFQYPPVDLNTPDRVEVKDIPYQYVPEAVSEYMDFEGKTSQTVLSFPNEICFNVEDHLDTFQLDIKPRTFTSEISPCGNFCSSSVQTNISLPESLPSSLEQALLPFQRDLEETFSEISILRRKLFGHDFNTSFILSPSRSEEDYNCHFNSEKQDKHFVPSLSPPFLQESGSCSPVISGSLLHVSECSLDDDRRRAIGTPPGEVQPPLPMFDISPIFKPRRPSRSASKLNFSSPKFVSPPMERGSFGKLESN